jgi:hypothetical protein
LRRLNVGGSSGEWYIPLNLHLSQRQIGSGETLEIRGAGVVGNAVWFGETLCHASAFATAEEKPRDRDENNVP